MIIVYGLKNCDTCRKARKWLDAEGLEHQFKDVRADTLTGETITAWITAVGWETLLNRRGTTWRNLADADKHAIDADKAQSLMSEHPALIKRPVFEINGKVLVGFKDDVQAALKE
ncbi:MAG: ArsC family reductase [Rhodospirillales bacterium]|nr:ArsC family reductase [Rhodospirillales bacterium]